MNIQSATHQVEAAVRAYLATDEQGLPLIPQPLQRPLILMGPPGVGKTAVVAQVAERLGVNFVSYAMTHHTRQSALGLPYIDEAEYGGRTYRVSRYTMSEIIARVHDEMAATGVSQGILFLDEVNCVSETLAPAMLQFLQYKTFGEHRLPEGWVVVCAGNPPEYNRAAREFDPAMLDRMKRLDVEPDLDVWMSWAVANGVHPAVTSYLEGKPSNFYKVRASVDGTRIVTARGWEDLSRMLLAFEQVGETADKDLVGQYLQDPNVAEDFSLYLEIFSRYRDGYGVSSILAGEASAALLNRASDAPFEERMALVSLIVAQVEARVAEEGTREAALRLVREDLLAAKGELDQGRPADQVLTEAVASAQDALAQASRSSESRRHLLAARAGVLRDVASRALRETGEASAFDAARAAFNDKLREVAALAGEVSSQIDAATGFALDAFGQREETFVLCTRLASDADFMAFVSTHGAPRFLAAAQGLMVRERGLELLSQVDALEELGE